MKSRMDVLRELLVELDQICRENNLKYTLVGEVANQIAENNTFPELYDYISVGMTLGDIHRLIKIVDDIDGRQIEYFMNNENARGLQFRFCNSNTTLINVKEIDNHVNYGFYIRIRPINDGSNTGFKAKILRLAKGVWKGSCKTMASSNSKRKVLVVLSKMIVGVLGCKNVRKWIYNYNYKLRAIDSWNDIASLNRVVIGKAAFVESEEWELVDVNVDGNTFMYAPNVIGRYIEALPTHQTVMMNDIENTEIPFTEIINNEQFSEFNKTKEYRDEYLKIVTLANKPAKYIKKCWNTYRMSKDVVAFEDTYNDEVISKIEDAMDNCNQELYFEYMQDYLRAKRRWRRLDVPFIKNDTLEDIIKRAKEVFEN